MTQVEVTTTNGVTVEVNQLRPSKSFNIIAVSGEDDVVSVAPNQTLNFEAGANMELTTDPNTNTVTFTSSVTAGDVDDGVLV